MKFGGLKFLDAAHVKDVLAFLRWAENPRDRVAGFRVAAAAARRRAGDRGAACSTRRRARAIALARDRRFSRRPPPPRHWPAFAALFGALRRDAAGLAGRARCGRARWYEPHLERIHDDAAMRARPISPSLSRSPRAIPSRERFLTELTLDPPDATSDEAGAPLLDEDYLILSTIHSAKGQEWKSVFVLNARRRLHPVRSRDRRRREEIEEERRLLYVAMTRAKDHLHLVVPQRFYVHQPARATATATSTRSARASSRAR